MRSRKMLLCAAALLSLSACGYSSRDNEAIGQVKKVANVTPILCFDRTDADISLGVMRNGVGSMSTQDMWLTVRNEKDAAVLRDAANTGKLVRFHYQVARINWCWQEEELTSVEIINN